MTDTDKVYAKLIEVAEDMAYTKSSMEAIKASYEEGRRHAKEASDRNEKDHQEICLKLDKKADADAVSGWMWVQKNPRIVFIGIAVVVGAAAGGEYGTGSAGDGFGELAGGGAAGPTAAFAGEAGKIE